MSATERDLKRALNCLLVTPTDTVASIVQIGAIFQLFTAGLETRPQPNHPAGAPPDALGPDDTNSKCAIFPEMNHE